MRFVLATTNAGKAREIDAILRAAGLDLECVSRPADFAAVDETGDTLEENARLKARAVRDATGEAAIADDTGLEVDALDGKPGVRSARFAGPDATDDDNVTLLLARLDGVPLEARRARFVTVAVAVFPDGRELAAIGSAEGMIASARRGTRGFGYDPVFLPDASDGRTFAELAPEEKDACSHRGAAFRTLAEGLSILDQAGHLDPGDGPDRREEV
ncbi:MAG TPA: RdgB/HAM1 family non-canonical purine NTP pyrophosphatase [Acidimicrobiia bacterium]